MITGLETSLGHLANPWKESALLTHDDHPRRKAWILPNRIDQIATTQIDVFPMKTKSNLIGLPALAALLYQLAPLALGQPNTPVNPPEPNPYPGCVRIFNGASFEGWEADRSTWTITNGAMRGVGGTSRLAYTKADYGSFRLIFTARMNPVNGDHLGVLFWGDRPTDPAKPKIDNAGWIQFMPPFAGMWDYHPPKHHNLPFQKLAPGSKDSTKWCTTEILCDLEKGTMRTAVDGIELARYTHPTPRERQDPEKRIIAGPIGMFRHGGGASEYRDIYLEANPKEDRLITVR